MKAVMFQGRTANHLDGEERAYASAQPVEPSVSVMPPEVAPAGTVTVMVKPSTTVKVVAGVH